MSNNCYSCRVYARERLRSQKLEDKRHLEASTFPESDCHIIDLLRAGGDAIQRLTEKSRNHPAQASENDQVTDDTSQTMTKNDINGSIRLRNDASNTSEPTQTCARFRIVTFTTAHNKPPEIEPDHCFRYWIFLIGPLISYLLESNVRRLRHARLYFSSSSRLLLVSILTLIMILTLTTGVQGIKCPAQCSCIWRHGKQTAECKNIGLTKIPSDIESLIQVLNLEGNKLVFLNRQVFVDAGLVNLQRLFLSNCDLEQIDELAFMRLTNLIELDLSDNKLVHIPTTAFRQLSTLRTLSLSGNRLTFLGHQAFSDLKYLTSLEVSNCRIDSVAIGAFEGLEKLEKLKIDGNLIEMLSAKAVKPLKSLHGMVLENNPWRCDCELRPLRQWLDANNVPNVSPICEKPPRVKGRYWKSLNLEDFACPPAFLNTTSAFHVFDGNNVTLECKTNGDPLPHIQWYWRDRVLGNLSEGISPKQIFTVTERGEREKTSSLTVTSVQEPNAGSYSCRAENVAAKVVKNFTVHVSRRPMTEVPSGIKDEEDKTQEVREQERGAIAGSDSNQSSDPLIGLIVGVVVGALLVLLVFTMVLLLCRRKRRERRKRAEDNASDGTLHKLAPTDKAPDGIDEADTKLLSPRPQSVSILPPAYLHHHELEPLEPLMDPRNSLSPHVWVVKDHVPPEWPPRRSPIPVPMPVAPHNSTGVANGDPEAHARLHNELADTLRRKGGGLGDRRQERELGDGSSEMETAGDTDQEGVVPKMVGNNANGQTQPPFETLRVRELQDRTGATGDEPDLLLLSDRPKRSQPMPSILDNQPHQIQNSSFHPSGVMTLGRRGHHGPSQPQQAGHLTPQPRICEWSNPYDHPSAYFRPVHSTGTLPLKPKPQLITPVLNTVKDTDDGGGSDGTEV